MAMKKGNNKRGDNQYKNPDGMYKAPVVGNHSKPTISGRIASSTKMAVGTAMVAAGAAVQKGGNKLSNYARANSRMAANVASAKKSVASARASRDSAKASRDSARMSGLKARAASHSASVSSESIKTRKINENISVDKRRLREPTKTDMNFARSIDYLNAQNLPPAQRQKVNFDRSIEALQTRDLQAKHRGPSSGRTVSPGKGTKISAGERINANFNRSIAEIERKNAASKPVPIASKGPKTRPNNRNKLAVRDNDPFWESRMIAKDVANGSYASGALSSEDRQKLGISQKGPMKRNNQYTPDENGVSSRAAHDALKYAPTNKGPKSRYVPIKIAAKEQTRKIKSMTAAFKKQK